MSKERPILGNGRKSLHEILAAGVLVATVVFLIYLLMNYQVVWAQPENFVKRYAVLRVQYPTLGALLLETFNWPLWESAPRLTRLLSSLFDVIDTHFRNYFNSNIFPHPSISVTWIFNLILSPIFLQRSLRLVGCTRLISYYSLAIYFSLPGVLSLMVMGFRPGKSVALFFIIYITYLMLKLSTTRKTFRIEKGYYLTMTEFKIITVFFVALFTDEIAFFALSPIVLLHHYRGLKSITLPISAAFVTIFYFLFTQLILPIIHGWAGFPLICEGHHCLNGQYEKQAKFFSTIFLDNVSLWYILKIIWLNLLNAIRDNIGVWLLWDFKWSISWWMGGVSLLGLILIIVSFFSYKRQGDNFPDLHGINGVQILLLFGSAILLHGLLMSLTDHPVWGVYWYGVFISVPFIIAVAFILSRISSNGVVARVCISVYSIILIFSNFINFISTNYAYKNFHYYPMRAHLLSDMFENRANKFDLTNKSFKTFDLFTTTQSFVSLGSKDTRYVNLPSELEYLIYETRICPWQSDYYHIIQRSSDEITVTCFSTYLPALLLELRKKQEIVQQIFSKEVANLIGLYDEDGTGRKAYLSLSNKGKLFLVNGEGNHSEINILNDRTLYAQTWNLTAIYDSNKDILFWQNGSFWTKNNSLPEFRQ